MTEHFPLKKSTASVDPFYPDSSYWTSEKLMMLQSRFKVSNFWRDHIFILCCSKLKILIDSWLIVKGTILAISCILKPLFWIMIWVKETRHSKLYDWRSDWIGFDIRNLSPWQSVFKQNIELNKKSSFKVTLGQDTKNPARIRLFTWFPKIPMIQKKRALFEFREIRRVASSHQRINLEEISTPPFVGWTHGAKSPRCSNWSRRPCSNVPCWFKRLMT